MCGGLLFVRESEDFALVLIPFKKKKKKKVHCLALHPLLLPHFRTFCLFMLFPHLCFFPLIPKCSSLLSFHLLSSCHECSVLADAPCWFLLPWSVLSTALSTGGNRGVPMNKTGPSPATHLQSEIV